MFQEPTNQTSEMDYIRALRSCRPGAKDARKYEVICAEIIKYLFKDEFSITSEQHRVCDGRQIMDLQCALRGTTEYWQTFMHLHNTKYVVFEFKNHAQTVGQNSIYVTRKYLCKPICRNVAFIISRKGFGRNAQYAAMSMLAEGLLIIDLTDTDLETMLLIKQRGAEPSDYLMRKIDMLLMNASV